jgi:hypothetical protein
MAAPLILAAAAVSAVGSLTQGQATSSALNAQAKLQQQNANEAEAQGQFEATKQGIVAAQKIGAIRANYGASGVTLNSGSAQAVLGASAANAELDRLEILHGTDVKAINYNNQASMNMYGANSAQAGSYLNAVGGLTKGVLGVAAMGTSAPLAGSPSTPITNSSFMMPVVGEEVNNPESTGVSPGNLESVL